MVHAGEANRAAAWKIPSLDPIVGFRPLRPTSRCDFDSKQWKQENSKNKAFEFESYTGNVHKFRHTIFLFVKKINLDEI